MLIPRRSPSSVWGLVPPYFRPTWRSRFLSRISKKVPIGKTQYSCVLHNILKELLTAYLHRVLKTELMHNFKNFYLIFFPKHLEMLNAAQFWTAGVDDFHSIVNNYRKQVKHRGHQLHCHKYRNIDYWKEYYLDLWYCPFRRERRFPCLTRHRR